MARSRSARVGDRGVRKRLVASASDHLDARAPLRGGFGHQSRAPLTNLEDVVVATSRIERVDDFIVCRLRIHSNGDSVAFTADALDLNHDVLPRDGASARLLDGGKLTAREKSRTRGTRALHGLRDALRQSNGAARMRFENESERATLSVEC